MSGPAEADLRGAGIAPSLVVTRHVLSHGVERMFPESSPGAPAKFAGAEWNAALEIEEKALEAWSGRAKFEITKGSTEPISAGVRFEFSRWSREDYLFMPAAVYAGNRFPAQPSRLVKSCDNLGPDMPVTITNVPRLEIGEGPSRIQLLTGDLATPAVGVWLRESGKGFLLFTRQGGSWGDHVLRFDENEERTRATLTLSTPGVREDTRYNGRVSSDRGVRLSAGDTLELAFDVHLFEAPDLPAFYERFFAVREEFPNPAARREEIPFSSCQAIQEEKYNAQNWVEEWGYYSVGMRECASQDWQTGWTGGMNATYPLIAEGDETTRQRGKSAIDFVFRHGQGASGLLRGCFTGGRWHDSEGVLTRYSADALYFILKSSLLLESRSEQAPEAWRQGALRVAEGFRTLWQKHGQLGQRLDVDSGEILMGESLNASLVPGALALAAQFFDDPAWTALAGEIAEHFWGKYVRHGLTHGGPGDILQCPDSESAFAMLESFMLLHAVTGEARWIERASATAHQCASWVMTYDFRFPPDSTFGRLGMLTTGTVFANVQNKHSAPGICSLSGASLLALYRATGDARHLRLIEQIAHAIPQFMSRADRPIVDRRPGQRWPVLAPGWMNERVNTSDWEVRGDPEHEIGVGEIFGGSTWSEVAMLLTHAELPGIYARPDDRTLAVLDHVEAKWITQDGKPALAVRNPTAFPAQIKVLVETAEEAAATRDILWGQGLPKISLAAGESKVLTEASITKS